MKRTITSLAALLFCVAFMTVRPSAIFAQDDIQGQHENENPIKYNYTVNQRGDQNIRITLAPVMPIITFGNPFDDGKLRLGGLGGLGYHYFLNSNWAIGVDASFGFNFTIGGNVFNYIPILATLTWQPTLGNFEFPVTLGVGFAWETYSKYTYWPGLVIKPQVGAHYRLASNWSIGADLSYMLMPQFLKFWHPDEGYDNYFAQFLDIELVAKYYF